ncbi:hypothetical protein D1007_11956 [Hordeum vulgare]|nr:hypothetical protein D1007_11956 [Hordeum vulgare]
MAEADWSSLPSDLVNRIADCLLASNDVDSYMDFRAVCTNWRSATNDPKNSADLRFRPRRWIVIDEIFQTDARLLVNTVSGRIVRKELPLLRGFYFVATHGGFFVLAEKKPPHAACVLNPLTGHMIRFVAPVIYEEEVSAYVVGSSPTLILLSHRTGMRYMADPDSECFTVHDDTEDHHHDTFPMKRLAFNGTAVYAGSEQGSVVLVTRGRFILEFNGEVFIIHNEQCNRVDFKLDTERQVLEPMNSIGGLAIFVGPRRCFAVNAEKFPSIAANCVYYVESTFSNFDIYKYDIEEKKEERLSEAIDYMLGRCYLLDLALGHLLNNLRSYPTPPFTTIQLLSSYTIIVRESQLGDQEIFTLENQPRGYIGHQYKPLLHVWFLNDLNEWVWKHDNDIFPILPNLDYGNRYDGPWILQQFDYHEHSDEDDSIVEDNREAIVEKEKFEAVVEEGKFEWNSDNDNVLEPEGR